jgi:hypothetical protein
MAGALLSECTSISIQNHQFCGSLGVQGAACSWFMPDSTHPDSRLDLQGFAVYWNDLSDPKVATSLSTITDWKADIEKLCTVTNDCSVQVQAKVNALYTKFNTVYSKLVTFRAPK